MPKPIEMFWDNSLSTVTFHVNILSEDAVDLVAFVLHVTNRNGGEITETHRFSSGESNEDGDRGGIAVDFGNVATAREAHAMRMQALTTDGVLKSTFKPALKSSDPRRVSSGVLLKQIRALPSNN